MHNSAGPGQGQARTRPGSRPGQGDSLLIFSFNFQGNYNDGGINYGVGTCEGREDFDFGCGFQGNYSSNVNRIECAGQVVKR